MDEFEITPEEMEEDLEFGLRLATATQLFPCFFNGHNHESAIENSIRVSKLLIASCR